MEETLSAEAVRAAQIEHIKQLFGNTMAVIESPIPLPDEKKLAQGLAILVDYSTYENQLCRLLGVVNHLDFTHHTDLWPQPKQQYQWIYGVTVREMPNVPDEEIEKVLSAEDLRGLSTKEALAVYREKPELLTDHCLEMPGSRHAGEMPLLCLGGCHPRLFVKMCRRCPRTVIACLR